MTLTPLEAVLIAAVIAAASSAATQFFLARKLVSQAMCAAHRNGCGNLSREMRVLKNMVRVLMSKAGIPIEEQLRLEQIDE